MAAMFSLNDITFINPAAHAQQGYSSLSVCLSVTVLTARVLILAVQAWYYQNRHDTSKVFDSSILLKVLCSKVMASFTSSIGTAIYQVLFVVYSYPNDDTETATFDLTVLIIIIVMLTIRS